ncbi:MAG: hypothetical protein SFW09_22045 [Hyphomicrobiaceae bacterium]|nr:hypothetical protein [Hyphomicrobiaceae bacterium]
MKRTAIAAALLGAVALPAVAADCTRDYKAFWDRFNAGPAKALTGDRMSIVSRQALRAFDACTGGNEEEARAIFGRLNQANAAQGEVFWQQLNAMSPGSR